MLSPKISTFREITPLIYSWTTPDIPKYAGWEKIGYTEQGKADARIAQQASQLSVDKKRLWSRRALFTSETGGHFTRFIGHQTTYRFVSESPSLDSRSPMTREQWRAYALNHKDQDPRIVEFLSLQDLKGARYFGGAYDKLKDVAEADWDLLVID